MSLPLPASVVSTLNIEGFRADEAEVRRNQLELIATTSTGDVIVFEEVDTITSEHVRAGKTRRHQIPPIVSVLFPALGDGYRIAVGKGGDLIMYVGSLPQNDGEKRPLTVIHNSVLKVPPTPPTLSRARTTRIALVAR